MLAEDLVVSFTVVFRFLMYGHNYSYSLQSTLHYTLG